MRRAPSRFFACLLVLIALFTAPAWADDEAFTAFLKDFEAKAVAAGIDASFYEQMTAGLTPDPDLPKLVETQPEFTTPVWDYIDVRASDKRIKNGKAGIKANAALFKRVGKSTGVDPYILAAIWGIETNYGSVLNDTRYIKPVVRSLATLVFQKRARVALDEAEFMAAMKLIAANKMTRDELVGSWAGALGHLQVNPTTVLKEGVDGDHDGKVDLDKSLADALATSAKFLLDLGWQPGVDWGFEVTLPPNFDYMLAGRDKVQPIGFFTAKGVKRVRGRSFGNPKLPVFLYVPAGKTGPKFLLTANYNVLKGYNLSDSYAMAVAHLADRLKGAKDYAQKWPRETKFPDLNQRKAIQQALIDLKFYTGAVDGRIGPASQAAYAQYQASKGEVADGFITLDAYDELTATTGK